MAGHARIETYQDDAGEWRWRCRSGNNEIVIPCEGHTREADATRAALTAAQLLYEAIDAAAIEHGTRDPGDAGGPNPAG